MIARPFWQQSKAYAFDSAALKLFRSYYPNGRNFLVTPTGDPAYTKRYGDLEVSVCSPTELHP